MQEIIVQDTKERVAKAVRYYNDYYAEGLEPIADTEFEYYGRYTTVVYCPDSWSSFDCEDLVDFLQAELKTSAELVY